MSVEPAETLFPVIGDSMAKKKGKAPSREKSVFRLPGFDPAHHIAIIVLGCKPYIKGKEISPELQARVGKGGELYQRDFGDFLLFTGGSPFSGMPEALIMKSLAPMVPREDIVLEMHSRSTRENAVLSKRILLRKGVGDIILVTSPYHVQRALSIFKEVFGDNFRIQAAASDYYPALRIRLWKRIVEAAKSSHLFPERWLQRVG